MNTKSYKPITSLRNERGAALIMVLGLSAIILAIIPVALRMTSQDFDRNTNYVDSRTAFYIAEAGVERAKDAMKSVDFDVILAGPDADASSTADNGTISGIGTITGGYNTVTYNNGSYAFKVMDNDDGDGNLNNDSDGIMIVESIGTSAAGSVKTLRAITYKYTIDPGDFPAAVTLVGPVSTISTGGNGFNVNGGDGNGGWTLDGYNNNDSQTQEGSCTAQTALATESTNAATDTSGLNQADNFDGIDGADPSITYSQTTFTNTDAQDMYDLLKPQVNGENVTGIHAGETDPDPDNWTTQHVVPNSADLGTLADPKISYYDGNIKINGSIAGAGVLIIDGDLNIIGSLDWAGIILIGSCSTCWGELVGTGGAEIYGAMVVGNNVDAIANFSGSAEIYYSCDGINAADGALTSSLSTVSWNEVS